MKKEYRTPCMGVIWLHVQSLLAAVSGEIGEETETQYSFDADFEEGQE